MFRTAAVIVGSLLLFGGQGCSEPFSDVPDRENTLERCQDQMDNDGDTFVDCQDQDCQVFTMCLNKDSGAPDVAPDGLPKLDWPLPDLPNLDLPGPDLPTPDLPKPDLPKPDLPKPDLPGLDLTRPDLPMPDLPMPDLPWPDLPKPDQATPDMKPVPPTGWAVSAGSSINDFGAGIAVDGSGNAYITGQFNGTAKFGSATLTSKGKSDIFVAKVGPSGKIIWATSAGGANLDVGRAVAVDGSGNAFVTGLFEGTATFGTFTLTSQIGYTAYLAKLSPNGKILWVFAPNPSKHSQAFAVAADKAGNAYFTGKYAYTSTFGTTSLTSKGFEDIFIVKVDASGKAGWATSVGGTGFDTGAGIAVDGAGNVYASGQFTSYLGGSTSFGSTVLKAKGNYDLYVARLNATGKVLWATSAGGSSSSDSANYTRVAVDGKGEVYIAGYFNGSAKFGTTSLTANGFRDGFVARLSSSGAFAWAKSWSTSGDNQGNGIAVDSAGNSYVTGDFRKTATCGTITVPGTGNSNVFVAKFTPAGSCAWATSAGGSSNGYGSGIAVGPQGMPHLTGGFTGTKTFGKTSLTPVGGYDIYAWKKLVP